MATNQQPAAGNNMAALLGNMNQQPQQRIPANWAAGLQAPVMGGGMQPSMGGPMGNYGQPPQPMQGGGPGGPMQAMPSAANTLTGMIGGAAGGPQRPMPSFGAPAAGAPGKGAAGQNPQLMQAIAGLRGGPPMGQQPGRRPMQTVGRVPGQGMQPPNPMLGR
jgi:hypothetical protein